MFILSEFFIESIIRKGLADIQIDIDFKLQDIFGNLNHEDIKDKYGSNAINEIKSYLMNKDKKMPILYDLNQLSSTNVYPAFSIHLRGDSEDEGKAGLGDIEGEENLAITPAVLIGSFNPISYNISSGEVKVADSVDCSLVYPGRHFIDGMGQDFIIKDPINDQNGQKSFHIDSDIAPISLVGCKIVSGITEKIYDKRYIPVNENLMIGVHANNALLLRYFYYVLKYIFYKSKPKFVEFNMQLVKFSGSDFSLNQTIMPEEINSRYITVQFVSYHSWRQQEKLIIDSIGDREKIVDFFTPISYDPNTGIVRVSDSTDLSNLESHFIFEDGNGKMFEVTGNIDNTIGNKHFGIAGGQIVSVGPNARIFKYYKFIVSGGGVDQEL